MFDPIEPRRQTVFRVDQFSSDPVHLKDYDKGGKQKFSVHLRIETPGQMISSEQHDWDLETALRKTFNNAKNSVKKKFKGDTSTDKFYN